MLLHRSAGQLRSNLRDDAVAAFQQAAVLDFDISSIAIGETRNPGGNVDHPEATQEIRQFALVRDHLRDPGQVGNFVWSPGCIAAHHHDAGIRVTARKSPNGLTTLCVTFVRDGAGIDDAQIRRLVFARIPKPCLQKALSHILGLVLVDLASQRQRFQDSVWIRHSLLFAKHLRAVPAQGSCPSVPSSASSTTCAAAGVRPWFRSRGLRQSRIHH